MERYVVDVKSARCPSKYWGRPVVVRVLDTSSGPSAWHWVRRGTVAQWGEQYSGRGMQHLDSKYAGARSAYGRALEAARTLAEKLNAAK